MAAVGCGRVFELYHLPALRQSSDWSLVAVCDADAKRLEWAAGVAPEAARVASVREINSREDVDAVLISTPPDTHAQLALASMEQGKHVLVEKPMATDLADADEMIRVSRANRCHLAIGFNRRFRRTYLAARDALKTAAPDQELSIRYEFLADALRWSRVIQDSEPAERLEFLLDDVASHQVDLLPWLLGRPAKAVRTVDSHVDSDRTLVDFEMEFSGGIIGRCRAGHGPRYREQVVAHRSRDGFVVFPAAIVKSRTGSGTWTQFRGAALSLGDLVASRIVRKPNRTLESFNRQLGGFASTVRGSGDPERGADGACGRQAVAALDACRTSLREGGSWQDVRASLVEENQ